MAETDATPLPADDSDIKRMSFEDAIASLERIVTDLERGDVPLDVSIRIYERGEKLKNHCERLLSAAEDKVEKIKLNRAGKPTGTEPLDPG
ncbi:exodeoxyribonuclease VII small subunit [Jiella mangrovi]|uniref:Exodeoxyribonuclease 7 small subunit n=1 Tax=Jiella mangrovi TaxID=2821407 RepID=A0ABS4BIM7_9HYPH|nr:exodeoxyribonuclease VII small subunit [Jiella mangrovi]MBP0616618.1 exodeoxyribonuclease VII small subunit [Jiella mangrovi]